MLMVQCYKVQTSKPSGGRSAAICLFPCRDCFVAIAPKVLPPAYRQGRLTPSYCEKAAQARRGEQFVHKNNISTLQITSPWGRACPTLGGVRVGSLRLKGGTCVVVSSIDPTKEDCIEKGFQ